MLGPLPVQPIIDRIASAAGVALCSGVAELTKALQQQPAKSGSVYVVTRESPASPIGLTGAMAQDVVVAVQVVQFVRHASDPAKGAAARTRMDTLTAAIRERLFGWIPSTAFRPFELGPDADQPGSVGWLIRVSMFRTTYHARAPIHA